MVLHEEKGSGVIGKRVDVCRRFVGTPEHLLIRLLGQRKCPINQTPPGGQVIDCMYPLVFTYTAHCLLVHLVETLHYG